MLTRLDQITVAASALGEFHVDIKLPSYTWAVKHNRRIIYRNHAVVYITDDTPAGISAANNWVRADVLRWCNRLQEGT